jgi:hypothetical protein
MLRYQALHFYVEKQTEQMIRSIDHVIAVRLLKQSKVKGASTTLWS